MYRYFFILIFLFTISYAIETDKQKHILVSAIIANKTLETSNKKVAFLTSLTIGLTKEIYDSTQKSNRFDTKDLLADILGSYIGVFSPKFIGTYTINSKNAYGLKLKF